jgi:hypothetical protein
MRHRFFLEDDLIKVGWGSDSTLEEWDHVLAWMLRVLDKSDETLHILMDLSDVYVVTGEMFHPEIAARLASHPNAGRLMLVNHNPIFVHFVNDHWQAPGLRAFLDASDALSWLRDKPLSLPDAEEP